MRSYFTLCLLLFTQLSFGQQSQKQAVLEQLNQVNKYWQSHHKPQVWAFWDQAAYHTGNMELYKSSL